MDLRLVYGVDVIVSFTELWKVMKYLIEIY